MKTLSPIFSEKREVDGIHKSSCDQTGAAYIKIYILNFIAHIKVSDFIWFLAH